MLEVELVDVSRLVPVPLVPIVVLEGSELEVLLRVLPGVPMVSVEPDDPVPPYVPLPDGLPVPVLVESLVVAVPVPDRSEGVVPELVVPLLPVPVVPDPVIVPLLPVPVLVESPVVAVPVPVVPEPVVVPVAVVPVRS